MSPSRLRKVCETRWLLASSYSLKDSWIGAYKYTGELERLGTMLLVFVYRDEGEAVHIGHGSLECALWVLQGVCGDGSPWIRLLF